MGDVHFILRHALTGAIFLIFLAVGAYALDPLPTLAFIEESLSLDGVPVALTVAVPILGITIQGAHILVLYWSGRLFTDPARMFVAKRLRDLAVNYQKRRSSYQQRTKEEAKVWASIVKAPADAIFVWLYHSFANHDLIEWARTRRSYYYLGINWVAAGLIGFVGGMAAVWAEPETDWRPFAALLGVLWAFGAVTAAFLMKRDADAMEALWAAVRADPEFRKEVWQLLGMTPGSTDPA
jgi:hypothetical protein